MRTILLAALLSCFISSQAQYYYKDIIGTKESAELMKTYMAAKVNRVILTSYDAANTRIEDFYVEQQFTPATRVLRTVSRNSNGGASTLLSYADEEGRVIRTVDSSDISVSTTTYTYNAAGKLVSVSSISADSSRSAVQQEEHIWQWAADQPSRMLRVKNRVDTAYVDFTLDENGNVSEEVETHRKQKSQPVYYYYNRSNLLTDVVRFNPKLGKLLPEYMFEYSEANRLIQKITVPGNSTEYLIWRYQYNPKGLRTKERIFSKHDKRKHIGQIEYQYTFGA